ncbi:probable cytochrome P450 305a1 isoform X2 [Zophobas morio]|uniref:probable cytochrome P450 305a1 isoform X2 n=1 Tax=Zophobas morio TaxID=2755281 RepID=UPI003083C74F
MNIILVGIFFITFFFYLINQIKRPSKFPPGPIWFPIVGNQVQLRILSKSLGGLHLALSYLSQKYKTGVLGLKLGKEYIVSVSGYPLIKEVFTREEFEGRPENFFFKMRSFGRLKSGITGTDGIGWSVHRSFVLRHFCSMGFGKTPMDAMVKNEIEEVLQILKNSRSNIRLSKLFAPAILNILWTLVAGKRIARDDLFLDEMLDLLSKRGKMFNVTGGVLNQFPWIRYIAPKWSGFRLIEYINGKLKKMISTTIEEHHDTWEEGRDDDLIYSYISEIKKSKNNPIFCDEELVVVCFDMFIAGSQITSGSLDLLFFMMTQYPEVQKKVQEEIDTKIGRESYIEYADVKRLPYTYAVLMEVLRYSHVAPIAGPRRVMRDTTLEGYFLPKEKWSSPETFKPERFLNEKGEFSTPENFLPFGLGRRRCLGEVLAKHCLFYFFVEVMRKYSVVMAPESEAISHLLLGITLTPENYKATFLER